MRRKPIWFAPVLTALLALGVQGATAPPASFPTFGVSFTAPADATFELTDSPTHIGIYRFNAGSPNAGAAILVEVAAANGKSVKDTSAANIAQTAATAPAGSFTVGGETAAKLTAALNAQSFTHRTTYLVVHEDRLYVFSALSTAAADASKSLDDLVATVHFVPIQSPLKCLTDFFDKPFKVFGRFTMNGPQFLRRVNNEPTLLHLGVYDYTAARNPLNLDIQRIQVAVPKTFADIRDAYSAGLQKNLNSPQPLFWHTLMEVPGLHVSQPIKTRIQAPDGTTTTSTNRFSILELGPGDFVQILFTISDSPDADVKAYTDLSDRMLATIKLLPAPPH
jgi:hypothetical protein